MSKKIVLVVGAGASVADVSTLPASLQVISHADARPLQTL